MENHMGRLQMIHGVDELIHAQHLRARLVHLSSVYFSL
ncbi:hypothetical protein NC652_022890 [Populus alba x Populus x berolinensis]|nr:hypothetical protein NC652_022890 [Populus alba x Populus x berolinensis]